jgi:hypothetical protein
MRIRPTIVALIPAAVLLLAAQAPSPQQLDPGQQLAMRCSAAFGIVADEQKRGIAGSSMWPPLAQRGREFFVRLGARLIDEKGFTRETLSARYKAEVEALQREMQLAKDPAAARQAVMAPCLDLLDATITLEGSRIR